MKNLDRIWIYSLVSGAWWSIRYSDSHEPLMIVIAYAFWLAAAVVWTISMFREYTGD